MIKHIPDEILKPFLHSYEKGDVWQVHCGDRWLIIFLYLDNQIVHNKDLPAYQKLKQEYYELIDKYLDLRISGPKDISLNFDSKENFDEKYKGSWQLYYT